MIVCPACGSPTSVRETRSGGNYFRRRRVCDKEDCGQRVSTIEVVVDDMPHGSDVAVIAKRDLEAVLAIIDGALGRKP